MRQRRLRDFLPLPAAPPFLAKQQSRFGAVLRCAAVASDAASIASGPPIAIEAAMVRARGREERRIIMATIGTFKKSGSDYTGEIVTLSVQAKNVRIVPEANRTGDNSPSHRVMVGRVEIGAAWAKALQRRPRLSRSEAGRSELHRSDLRQPLRRRGRRRVQPHLVPPQRPPHRRVKPVSKPRPVEPGGAFALCRHRID